MTLVGLTRELCTHRSADAFALRPESEPEIRLDAEARVSSRAGVRCAPPETPGITRKQKRPSQSGANVLSAALDDMRLERIARTRERVEELSEEFDVILRAPLLLFRQQSEGGIAAAADDAQVERGE